MDFQIILQQTRVAQGYDYFLRFIKRFPDVQSLADADEDEVIKDSGRGWDIDNVRVIFMRRQKAPDGVSLRHIRKYLL